jgi:hypothetical protein
MKLNKKILTIENFLPNLNHYLKDIHKISLYEQEEFNNKFNSKQIWPGKRSNFLHLENSFLFFLILQNLEKIDFLKKYVVDLYLHLRREDDFYKDWIHVDSPHDYSFLIYLNKNNFSSGTYIYDENKQIISDIKYIQNRFVIFNSSYNHMGYGHFGNNSENGRLTLNGFITLKD